MNDQRRPGAEADRVVDLRRRRHAVVDEPERLAPERLEHAVGHEAVDLLAHDERRHAERADRGRARARSSPATCARPPHSSTSGSRYTGLNGCATRKRSGRPISAASAVGRSPEVDEAMSTSGPAAAQTSASSACLSSSALGRALLHELDALGRGGWRSARPSAQPSRGSGTADSRAERPARELAASRRACARPRDRGRRGGRRCPPSRKRAAQPPPITPPPSRPTARGALMPAAATSRARRAGPRARATAGACASRARSGPRR